ncbi:hypothetical protein M378DRAFT_25233 [Amanita muscaria Koide BX008]|uniref:Uncharacterized protein n=1 Tax=Amanita muscaria (strain Koide BX008) TaxID=946122 RepID=A0A0C2T930_AMAMK|nr:hypothetical protein M378DRAFT_25233 [Amanita muscaria Koide BX008]
MNQVRSVLTGREEPNAVKGGSQNGGIRQIHGRRQGDYNSRVNSSNREISRIGTAGPRVRYPPPPSWMSRDGGLGRVVHGRLDSGSRRTTTLVWEFTFSSRKEHAIVLLQVLGHVPYPQHGIFGEDLVILGRRYYLDLLNQHCTPLIEN